jgi:hypothetical protein
MRYEKKVVILSSVLVALLLIWGAGILFSPERVAARSESAHLLAGKPADVATISIKLPAGAFDLTKSGSSWSLLDGAAKLPVQASRVSSFLDDLAAISRLRVVARSKDSWAGFQLDDANAKRATLKDASGKLLADLFIGGYGPTGSELYLRLAGSDLSYSAETGIASYFGSNRSSWLDLKILGDIKESDIQSFSVKSDIALDGKGKPSLVLDYNLHREGQGWKAGTGTPQIDAESTSSLLRSIVGLQGEDYVASPPGDAFTKVTARIDLELGTGKSKVLELGSTVGDNRFYGRVVGDPIAFTVANYSLHAVLKSLADLAPAKK